MTSDVRPWIAVRDRAPPAVERSEPFADMRRTPHRAHRRRSRPATLRGGARRRSRRRNAMRAYSAGRVSATGRRAHRLPPACRASLRSPAPPDRRRPRPPPVADRPGPNPASGHARSAATIPNHRGSPRTRTTAIPAGTRFSLPTLGAPTSTSGSTGQRGVCALGTPTVKKIRRRDRKEAPGERARTVDDTFPWRCDLAGVYRKRGSSRVCVGNFLLISPDVVGDLAANARSQLAVHEDG